MNKKFVKLDTYNRYDHSTIVPAYINLNYIVSLAVIADTKESWYILYLVENSYRITEKSYKWLVNFIYGKEYNNA